MQNQVILSFVAHEKISLPAHHRTIVIVEHDGRVFELQGDFFKKRQRFFFRAAKWLQRFKRQAPLAVTAEAEAAARLAAFQLRLETTRYQYVGTITAPSDRGVYQVVLLSVDTFDFWRLAAGAHLTELPLVPQAPERARLRAALLAIAGRYAMTAPAVA